MQTWEYLILKAGKGKKSNDWIIQTPQQELPYTNLADLLNQLGKEGWELINVSTKIKSEKPPIMDYIYTFTSSETYYFKRPK